MICVIIRFNYSLHTEEWVWLWRLVTFSSPPVLPLCSLLRTSAKSGCWFCGWFIPSEVHRSDLELLPPSCRLLKCVSTGTHCQAKHGIKIFMGLHICHCEFEISGVNNDTISQTDALQKSLLSQMPEANKISQYQPIHGTWPSLLHLLRSLKEGMSFICRFYLCLLLWKIF